VISNESTDLGEEINPYLVYRLSGEQMECAIWTLNEGQQALALFLSQESAEAYVSATGLGEAWKFFCPARIDLLQIIKQSTTTGIFVAVLDPDDKQAKRLFDLRQIVSAADRE
jgi:hypothetical protein